MAYDSRAVKVSKSVKRIAATIIDNHRRRDFIKGFVKAEEALVRQSLSRKRDKE